MTMRLCCVCHQLAPFEMTTSTFSAVEYVCMNHIGPRVHHHLATNVTVRIRHYLNTSADNPVPTAA